MYVIKFDNGYFSMDHGKQFATQRNALRFDDTDRASMTDLAAKLGGRWIKLVTRAAVILLMAVGSTACHNMDSITGPSTSTCVTSACADGSTVAILD